MKKSIISIALVLCILFAVASPFAVHATEPEIFMVPNYQMYQKFMADTYPVLFRDRLYLATLDSLTGLDKCIGAASVLIEEDLSVERCTQLLANMATLMNYQLEEAIVEQATVDTTMTLSNYGVKAADIAAGIVGADSLKKAANSVMQGIATTMGIANGVLDVTVDTKEKLELLVQLQGDYSMQYAFLEAIYVYADIPEMKEAAQTLMLANEQIMLHKLEVFNSTTASTTKFAAHDVFLDQVAEDLLNDPDFFDSDAWLGVKALSTAYSLYSGAKLAFDITLFLGDVMFGVHDIYNRYNEMVAMRDIRQALLSRVEANPALNEEDYENMDRNISLMKMSLYIDARGEYCAYKMITEDGKLAKLFSTTNQKSIEDNYNDSVLLIENSFENLEMLRRVWATPNAEQKRLVSMIHYDGDQKEEYFFSYNEYGLMTEVTGISPMGGDEIVCIQRMIYDTNGRLTESWLPWNDWTVVPMDCYQYSEKGYLLSETHSEGSSTEEKYVLDQNGRALKKEATFEGGSETHTYSYDSEGRLSHDTVVTTHLDGYRCTDYYSYEYDEQGKLIVAHEPFLGTPIDRTYSYDYMPFIAVTSTRGTGKTPETILKIQDCMGHDVLNLSTFGYVLYNPKYTVDDEGYLIQITESGYNEDGSTLVFVYEEMNNTESSPYDHEEIIVNAGSEMPYEAVNANSQWNVYGSNGQLYDNYTLRIHDKQNLVNFVHAGPMDDPDPTVTEYVIGNTEPFAIALEEGYAYTFEFVDNADTEKVKLMTVGVTDNDPLLTSVVDVETEFGTDSLKIPNNAELAFPISEDACYIVYQNWAEEATDGSGIEDAVATYSPDTPYAFFMLEWFWEGDSRVPGWYFEINLSTGECAVGAPGSTPYRFMAVDYYY